MTLLPPPLNLAATAAERVQPAAPGSSSGSSKMALANTGIAAAKMPSEVPLLEQAGLQPGRPLTTARMCILRVSTCCWQDFSVCCCRCCYGLAEPGPTRRRNRPSSLTAGSAPGICLTGHQVIARWLWTATRPCPIFRPAPASVGLPRHGDGAWSTVSCMAPSFRFGGGLDLGPAARSHASAGPLS